MNDQNQFDRGGKSFKEESRNQIRQMGWEKGGCPDPQWLLQFQSGELSENDTTSIKEHIRVCGICDWLLGHMESFDEVAEKKDLRLPPDEWKGVNESLTARLEAFLEGQKKTGEVQEQGRFFSKFMGAVAAFFSKPVVAYVMVLLLLFPAYRGIFLKPQVIKEKEVIREPLRVEVTKRPYAFEPTRSFKKLEPARAATPATASTEEGTLIRLAKQDTAFSVSFSVRISKRPSLRYYVEIADREGKAIGGPQELASKDFYKDQELTLYKEFFPSGRYVLTVKEVDQSTQAINKVETFKFTVKQE